MSSTLDSSFDDPQQVIADLQHRLASRTAERDEALAREAAAAEVLQVINASPGDLMPVFEAMLDRAMRLCEADIGNFWTYDGYAFAPAVMRGAQQEHVDWAMQRPRRGGSGSISAQLVEGADLIHIPDAADTDAYRAGDPVRRAMVDLNGGRTLLAVALRKNEQLLGYIIVYRREVRPFTDRQIALLQNFAAQAVIAMENARLLTETREALEQQTATAEVLGVINSSLGDLTPVFDAILEKAHQLCGVHRGSLQLFDGDRFRAVATHFPPDAEAFAERLRQGYPATDTPLLQPLRGGVRFVHVPDLAEVDDPVARAAIAAGTRSILYVPLRQDDAFLGMIVAAREEVRPFSEKEIALLQNFAAQAVIAMENARLITETREALEQQTATAEVLGVINSSPGDLTPVFDAMLERATRLCEADFGTLWTFDGDRFRPAVGRGHGAAGPNTMPEGVRPAPGVPLGRLIAGENVAHVVDAATDDAFQSDPAIRSRITALGSRSALAVALRKDDALLGAITANRKRVEPYSDKQIALMQNFAAQAVIAMENARLLRELRQRTEEVAELNRGLEVRVAEQVAELGRVGRLKRFLAPQLAEMIVSQGDEKILESHRREIVVVFCDLRGYTAFTETAEPEEVLDFLREYHGALGPLVGQYEGTLDQFSGDGIMVFFNDPVPIPDPAERAVKMAMAMREAAGALIADWRERGRDLGFGAGIAQGYATLGQIGFSERAGYTAIGTVCNVAARLCAEAKDGQILLSQRVNVALKGSIATEQLGPLALKGLTQPVVAYNVPLAATQPALRMIQGGPSL